MQRSKEDVKDAAAAVVVVVLLVVVPVNCCRVNEERMCVCAGFSCWFARKEKKDNDTPNRMNRNVRLSDQVQTSKRFSSALSSFGSDWGNAQITLVSSHSMHSSFSFSFSFLN